MCWPSIYILTPKKTAKTFFTKILRLTRLLKWVITQYNYIYFHSNNSKKIPTASKKKRKLIISTIPKPLYIWPKFKYTKCFFSQNLHFYLWNNNIGLYLKETSWRLFLSLMFGRKVPWPNTFRMGMSLSSVGKTFDFPPIYGKGAVK